MLEVRNLHVSYGKIEALHGVSLRVHLKEIVTLIGVNGAGKSTFLKTVSGLLSATEGEIIFEGDKITRLKGHEITKRGIVLIPEGRRIFPLLTVEENLMMGAYFRKDKVHIKSDKDRFMELFPILKNRQKQMGGTLSGGEQQMLAMARALMGKPKLLMLDEPSMGLSPVFVNKIFSAVRDINKDGVTILLVEQNARAALGMAERGYVFETGRVVLEDNTKNLLMNDRVKQCYLGMEESTIT